MQLDPFRPHLREELIQSIAPTLTVFQRIECFFHVLFKPAENKTQAREEYLFKLAGRIQKKIVNTKLHTYVDNLHLNKRVTTCYFNLISHSHGLRPVGTIFSEIEQMQRINASLNCIKLEDSPTLQKAENLEILENIVKNLVNQYEYETLQNELQILEEEIGETWKKAYPNETLPKRFKLDKYERVRLLERINTSFEKYQNIKNKTTKQQGYVEALSQLSELIPLYNERAREDISTQNIFQQIIQNPKRLGMTLPLGKKQKAFNSSVQNILGWIEKNKEIFPAAEGIQSIQSLDNTSAISTLLEILGLFLNSEVSREFLSIIKDDLYHSVAMIMTSDETQFEAFNAEKISPEIFNLPLGNLIIKFMLNPLFTALDKPKWERTDRIRVLKSKLNAIDPDDEDKIKKVSAKIKTLQQEKSMVQTIKQAPIAPIFTALNAGISLTTPIKGFIDFAAPIAMPHLEENTEKREALDQLIPDVTALIQILLKTAHAKRLKQAQKWLDSVKSYANAGKENIEKKQAISINFLFLLSDIFTDLENYFTEDEGISLIETVPSNLESDLPKNLTREELKSYINKLNLNLDPKITACYFASTNRKSRTHETVVRDIEKMIRINEMLPFIHLELPFLEKLPDLNTFEIVVETILKQQQLHTIDNELKELENQIRAKYSLAFNNETCPARFSLDQSVRDDQLAKVDRSLTKHKELLTKKIRGKTKKDIEELKLVDKQFSQQFKAAKALKKLVKLISQYNNAITEQSTFEKNIYQKMLEDPKVLGALLPLGENKQEFDQSIERVQNWMFDQENTFPHLKSVLSVQKLPAFSSIDTLLKLLHSVLNSEISASLFSILKKDLNHAAPYDEKEHPLKLSTSALIHKFMFSPLFTLFNRPPKEREEEIRALTKLKLHLETESDEMAEELENTNSLIKKLKKEQSIVSAARFTPVGLIFSLIPLAVGLTSPIAGAIQSAIPLIMPHLEKNADKAKAIEKVIPEVVTLLQLLLKAGYAQSKERLNQFKDFCLELQEYANRKNHDEETLVINFLKLTSDILTDFEEYLSK